MPDETYMSGPGMATEEQIKASYVGELKPYAVKVVVDDYDPNWPRWYERDRAEIVEALGDKVLLLEHVGSTSVPGLPAKPIIDMLLVVADAADEAAYLPALEALGYKLRVREPDWHEHRAFAKRVDEGDDHGVNLHVHPTGSPEIARMIDFRDWLRRNDSDRDLYARTKRELAAKRWKYVQNYADAKTEVIEQIKSRYGG